MNAQLIEHRRATRCLDLGRALGARVGNASRAREYRCAIARKVGRHASTRLAFEVDTDHRPGVQVSIVLRENGMAVSALAGYLFPALAMLLGAWFGSCVDGSEGARALGAMAVFLAAQTALRLLTRLIPGLLPGPQTLPRPRQDHSNASQPEVPHDR